MALPSATGCNGTSWTTNYVVDQGGLFSVKLPIPAGTLAPGRPGSIEFIGASISVPGLDLLATQRVLWPKN